MKTIKFLKPLFLIIIIPLLYSFMSYHKFYVSVTQIDYNEKKSRIEIASRIFIDDLEKVLNKKTGEIMYLATKKENEKARNFIENYLIEKTKYKINGNELNQIFLGFEYEDDVIICYSKIDYSKKITTFGCQNNILFDGFSDQQNIIHTNIHNTKKSFLLTIKENIALVKY